MLVCGKPRQRHRLNYRLQTDTNLPCPLFDQAVGSDLWLVSEQLWYTSRPPPPLVVGQQQRFGRAHKATVAWLQPMDKHPCEAAVPTDAGLAFVVLLLWMHKGS